MKKLLISLLSFVALTSFAKTADELVAEYLSKAKINNDYALAYNIIKSESDADAKAAVISWANGDAGKFDAEDKRSEQSKKYVQAARLLAGQYLKWSKPELIKELPLIFACEAASTIVLKVYEVDNPTLYSELKAKNFTLDGVKLRNHAIINLACLAGDFDYVMSLPLQETIHNNSFRSVLVKHLLKMPVAEAKAKVVEIENWYIERDREIPANIKAVSKVLTSRLVDSKLQGK